MAESLKQKTAKGVVWSAVDRFAAQGIQFLIGLVMARLLMPSDYGTIALLNVFLAICQTFIDSGFGLALMRKKDCSEQDFSTVFIFSAIVSIVCYAILWVIAPLIARFYDLPILVAVARVVSLNVIINALSNVPNAQLSISLDFRKKAFVTLTTVVVSGSIGLWMAYNGFGLWALVYQTLVAGGIRTVLLFVCAKWLPKWQFSRVSFRELFSFGSKMLISGIIGNIYNNLSSIVIGKFYSPASLGVYGKANTLASYPSMQMTGVILNVAYPALAKIQDDVPRLIDAYRKMLRMSTFVIFPLMIGLAAVAKPFVLFVLGDKWAEMIPLLQIVCFALMWDPINGMNMNLLQVKGYSNIYLRVEIYKKIIGVVALCITIPFGLKAICFGLLVIALINIPINTYYTNKMFAYGFVRQLKDVFPIFIHALTMGALVFGFTEWVEVVPVQLFGGIAIGVGYYVLGGYLFQLVELHTLWSMLRCR
ncbi:MAG: lipopolysaccharide biosynthesis protein [Rikenellaceae bacterium]|nr:lipopolysaccharide biosynthesis protein [Rikenellaceae bacterium]